MNSISKIDFYLNRAPCFTNIAIFIVIFLLLYNFIIFFNLDTLHSVLDNHWQIADIEALKRDPVSSLLHLHSQPPLFNFFYWILSVLPGNAYDNFVILNTFCQTIVALILILLTANILKTKVGGIILGILYVISPSVLLNSAYPFYPPLTSMGFSLLIYGFYLLKIKPKIASILIGFSICYLYMIRSSFSLLAGIILITLYIFIARNDLSKIFISIVTSITLIILSALPLKNLFMYDFFASSSWTPVNLIMTFGIKAPLGPFPTPGWIRENFPELTCKKSYGILDTENNKANGMPNYNSCFYIAYIDKYGHISLDSLNFFIYFKNVARNVIQYFNTPDGYYFLKNRDQIKTYSFVYNLTFLTLYYKFQQIRLLCIFLVFFLCYQVYRDRRYFSSCLLIIFSLHFFAHILTDGGESRRHVFDVEFFFFIIFALFISSILKKFLK